VKTESYLLCCSESDLIKQRVWELSILWETTRTFNVYSLAYGQSFRNFKA
jgi:hypothetical protein